MFCFQHTKQKSNHSGDQLKKKKNCKNTDFKIVIKDHLFQTNSNILQISLFGFQIFQFQTQIGLQQTQTLSCNISDEKPIQKKNLKKKIYIKQNFNEILMVWKIPDRNIKLSSFYFPIMNKFLFYSKKKLFSCMKKVFIKDISYYNILIQIFFIFFN